MIVFFNGTYMDDSKVCISLWDGGMQAGHGVYETLRTYHGAIKFLNEHLERFVASAKSLGLVIPYSKEEMGSFVGRLIEKRKTELGDTACDMRVRMTLTSGTDNFRTGVIANFTFFITADAMREPVAWNVKLVTFDIHRNSPEIKSTSMLPSILAKIHARAHDAYESVMIDSHGLVTEGTFTNIFLVKHDVLITPAGGMLHGITRGVVLKLVKKNKLMAVEERDIKKNELYGADEIFLTNSIQGVVNVIQVDEKLFSENPSYATRIKNLYDDFLITV